MGVDSTQGSTPPARGPLSARLRGSLVYAVAIAIVLLGALGVALYEISREDPLPERAQLEPPRSAPLAEPRPEVPPPPAARRDPSDDFLLQLGSLSEQIDALAQHSAALRRRVDGLERELAQRPTAAPASAPAPGSAAPLDLASLFGRMSALELQLEREGAERIRAQDDLLARVFQLESAREEGAAGRLAAQKSAEERVYNVEQRIEGAERQLLELERRVSARIERLESR